MSSRAAVSAPPFISCSQHKPKNILFIAISFERPHLPFTAPKKYRDLYDPDEIKATSYQQMAKNDRDLFSLRPCMYSTVTAFIKGAFAQHIWILNDGDFDVFNPPFNDSLKIYTHEGTRVAAAGGFIVTPEIGTPRRLAVTPDGQYCWLAECPPSVVTSLIDLNGQTVLQRELGPGAVDVGRNGNVYILTTSGTIKGDSLIVLDSDGQYLKGTGESGYDLVVDDNHNAIWVVGADVKRLSKDLQLLMTIDPINWSASSVDFAADGTAWLVERANRALGPAAKDRILHIDTNGTILDSLENPDWFLPLCIRVDRKENMIWVAARSGLYKYDPAVAKWTIIDEGRGNALTIDQFHGLIWASLDNKVKSYDKSGQVQTVIDGFDESDSNIWVAIQKWETTTRIGQKQQPIPQTFSLQQNFPNPFNPSTTLPLTLAKGSNLRVAVYDMLGKKVKTLYNGFLPAGHHHLYWNGRDDTGKPVPSGVYVYRLNNHDTIHLSGKMLLLK
ncbi:T9SS type A sorting domain-containing protein [candidate division KSB1 bacterium]|nr:T9SS type A sorting domain-containing protein [candidate division KSB1 bacterium]